ncbi:MAG: hypothetical protein K2L02_01790, partial [Clostridia bacterium]|nr:hypothetical protein [Clostridia bacterium]
RIIVDTMKSAELEILIEEYHEREKAERNGMLRARLARPCSREELISRLGGNSSRREEGAILLTKSSSPSIMEFAR